MARPGKSDVQIAHTWVYDEVQKPCDWEVERGSGQQSPVRISSEPPQPTETEPLTIQYRAAVAKVKYKYPALEFYPEKEGDWGYLEIGCETWNLVKIHAHAKAEHSLFCHDEFTQSKKKSRKKKSQGSDESGESHHPLLPAEIHFVHTRVDKKQDGYLVLGVFARDAMEGEQPVHLPFLDHLREGHHELTSDGLVLHAGVALCPGCLLPGQRDYYSYRGSLTTPPCSENVNFLLFPQTIPVCGNQLVEFDQLFPGGTNRRIQTSPPTLIVRRNGR